MANVPYKFIQSSVLALPAGNIVFDDNPEVAHEISAMLRIDGSDLSNEYIHQAGMYGYIGAQQAKAEYAASVAKAELERSYARIDASVRKHYEQNGWKYTEAVIKGEVLRNSVYMDANSAYMEAEYYAALMKIMVKAMDQRADMLISLGATSRQEYAMTDMHVNDNIANTAKQRIAELKRKGSNQV